MIESLRDILVFSDMDGTLLTDDKQITTANMETIRLFTMLGGRFSIATGRVVESIAYYEALLPYLSLSISSGGCTLYDFATGQVRQNELLPESVARQALRDVIRQFPRLGVVIMAGNQKTYQLNGNRQTDKLFSDENISYLVHPLEYLPASWNKVMFAGPPDMLEKVEYYVARRDYPGTYFVATDAHYFEMLPKDVTKGTALLRICDLLGVEPENTFAIGDYYNDMDMLRAAGHAVAMDNAPKEIQMLADSSTAGCNESGVGQFLYGLIQKYAK